MREREIFKSLGNTNIQRADLHAISQHEVTSEPLSSTIPKFLINGHNNCLIPLTLRNRQQWSCGPHHSVAYQETKKLTDLPNLAAGSHNIKFLSRMVKPKTIIKYLYRKL